MSENKTGKYFKYAIGEIILVVIGILIALQINNWNENKKLRKIETEILKEVKANLENDLDGIRENLNQFKHKNISENIIINWIEGNESFNDSLSIHFNSIQFGVEFNYNVTPYETLKQMGMRTIKNDSLRNQIATLYDTNYEGYNRLIEYQHSYQSKIHDLEVKYFNEIGLLDLTIMKPININGLRTDHDLMFRYKSFRNYNETFLKFFVPEIEIEIIKSIEMIDQELLMRN
ncbi:DUF6090 family protein [Winogradskyella sp.]|uniref:DUF6090 family protein n=1 Tax=Winogradskyella sp. TaxID=1883156 RepID=UPI0025DF0CDB|nr:DUF6090 family protein [Winogradskyella sp.]